MNTRSVSAATGWIARPSAVRQLRPCLCQQARYHRNANSFSHSGLNIRNGNGQLQLLHQGTKKRCDIDARHYMTPSSQRDVSIKEHNRQVAQIAEAVKGFNERGEKFRIFHGSTNSTRKSALGRDPKKVVDTSLLNKVLHIDAEKQTALVEPNVPMDRLVEATLKHGLVPPVVMEFPGITAGGGYSGTSGESSSFKHGYFDRTLNSIELVLANGDVIACSEKDHPDLFRGAAGAVGTFGVTTLVEIQLQKAARFVETTYHPVSGMDEAIAMTKSFTQPNSGYDYVDGIMYSQTLGAVITGRLTDEPKDLPIQRFSHAKDPWFYLHVRERITDRSASVTEAIPLPEYLFRYDRGGFWVAMAAFNYFGAPFNSFTRWFLDDFLHTRMLYKALHGSGQTERMFVQDLALPYETAKEFVEYTDDRLGIWPLWLCPLKQSPGPTMHPHPVGKYAGSVDDGMLNIGLWGLGPPTREAFNQANSDVEQKLLELGGMKWLYAQTYYREEAFWGQFDKKWYNDLRKKYHATGLPDVYEKVRADKSLTTTKPTWSQWAFDIWPISGLYGLKRAINSKDYLQARSSAWKDWVPRV